MGLGLHHFQLLSLPWAGRTRAPGRLGLGRTPSPHCLAEGPGNTADNTGLLPEARRRYQGTRWGKPGWLRWGSPWLWILESGVTAPHWVERFLKKNKTRKQKTEREPHGTGKARDLRRTSGSLLSRRLGVRKHKTGCSPHGGGQGRAMGHSSCVSSQSLWQRAAEVVALLLETRKPGQRETKQIGSSASSQGMSEPPAAGIPLAPEPPSDERGPRNRDSGLFLLRTRFHLLSKVCQG